MYVDLSTLFLIFFSYATEERVQEELIEVL